MFRRDEGAAAVVVAICLMVFVGFSALVIDMGYWYNVRRQLQAAADSAALAGCQELIHGATDAEIWTVVEEYAHTNESGPVEACSVVPPSAGGLSDITLDSVKVTLTTVSTSFFGRVLGIDSNQISAQARAKVGFLVGAQTPVPWGLPILRATRVTAQAGGGAEIPLTETASGSGVWEGDLPAGSRGYVTVRAYNDQTLDPAYPDGVPEEAAPVARLLDLPLGSRISDIRIEDPTTTSEWAEDVVVRVDVPGGLGASESVVVVADKKRHTAVLESGSTYIARFDAPSSDDLFDTTNIDVVIASGGSAVEEVKDAGVLVMRRSTYPLLNITTSNTVYAAGELGLAHVSVEFNEYQIGQPYELKVVGGAGEAGNFMAVDYSTLRHTPYWRAPQDPAEYPEMPSGTSTYYDYIAGTADYDFIVHIGDTVWTEPGNMSGPQTRAALDTRFDGEPSDYAGWLAADKPGSNRLVYVPVTEKIQVTTGTSPLRVVTFAMFYVEDVVSKSGDALVRGRFVEYSAPSWAVSPTPPDPDYVIEVAHLVAEGVDF